VFEQFHKSLLKSISTKWAKEDLPKVRKAKQLGLEMSQYFCRVAPNKGLWLVIKMIIVLDFACAFRQAEIHKFTRSFVTWNRCLDNPDVPWRASFTVPDWSSNNKTHKGLAFELPTWSLVPEDDDPNFESKFSLDSSQDDVSAKFELNNTQDLLRFFWMLNDVIGKELRDDRLMHSYSATI